jgi:DNA-binding NarL/FixJ family response regulator
MTTRILLADDHEIMREGIRAILERETDLEVVAEASNGRDALARVRDCQPDLVLMDIGMPDMNGVEATRQILAEAPEVKVVALSMHADKRFVASMFQAGATAYLLKKSAARELLEAIGEVMKGQIYLGSQVAGVVVQDYVQHLGKDPSSSPDGLSPREREVLQLIVEGNTTPEIASVLNVSEKTVGTHRQHIMEKLDIHTIAELTKYAIREGLTFLES